MPELVRLTVQNPAKVLDIEAGEIAVGEKANLILLDTNAEYIIANKQSLYDGEILFGKIRII
jgi:dihydroorotase